LPGFCLVQTRCYVPAGCNYFSGTLNLSSASVKFEFCLVQLPCCHIRIPLAFLMEEGGLGWISGSSVNKTTYTMNIHLCLGRLAPVPFVSHLDGWRLMHICNLERGWI